MKYLKNKEMDDIVINISKLEIFKIEVMLDILKINKF